MQIRLLGPLEAGVDDRAVTLGGAKQRAVLAMLALEANHVVTADRLVEGLWGEDPPASAAKMIQNHVWRLRTALHDDAGAGIVTRGRGYELRIDPDGVDVGRFERLVLAAGRAAAAGEASDAAREALALWRGPALTDVTDEPFAAAEIRRLEELRLQAAELAIDADLAAGFHHEVVAEIERLVAEHPFRERLHAQRMLALYRCARQAEALEAYREARRTLVDAVGLEPGAELQRLQDAILRQDPSLDVESAGTELPRELAHAAATPIVGRDRELEWLRARWARALGGNGVVVAVTGEQGSGKTRLAAELATEVHHAGGRVLFVSGFARPEAVVAALRGARQARSPTLLVVDDPGAASGLVDRLVEFAGALPGRPVLVLAAVAGLGDVVLESLALAPLDRAAVQRIAQLYAPDGGVALDGLLADSRGVPRRLHELASERALQAATRRVQASAPRAAAGRSELRSAEHELAGGVVALQIARERFNQVDDDARAVCPFKGLASFEVADAPYFFGRERLVAELVARAVGAPLLGVVGPSGSGKSSVIRAGLLASLAAGVLPGSGDWSHVVVRPGEHPMRELQAIDGGSTVLAVDQFEEIFTACRDESERAAFIDVLVARAQAGHGLVVVAMRADFYGRCAAYPALSNLLGTNQVLVGAMSDGELRRAIERPAQRAGLHVEADLVDALVDDVAGEPGGLPLLSAALLELWEQRDGRALAHAAYVRTGGVRGAVSRLAEDAFGRLDPGQQRLTRAVMLRLAGEDTGGDVVRRRVPLSELEGTRDDDLTTVLGVLTERRLLTTSATSVEVAHEALLREWPRLRGWLREDAEGRRIQRHLAGAARDWDDRGRDPADLYRGARLAVASEWRTDHEEELNPVGRAFLDAGRAAAQRANRRLRLALAGVAALLVAALAGGLVAVHQRGTARREARVADAQRIGVQALSEPQLDRSLLLARQAVALDNSPATRSDLLGVLLRAPAVMAVVPGTGNPVTAVDVAPDGRILALGDDRGNLLLVDAVTHRRLGAQLKRGASITAVRFSPDGGRLAVAGYTTGNLGFVELVDARTRRASRLRTGFDSEINTSGVLATGALAFSPDSRMLAADILAAGPASGYHRFLVLWDARSGRRLGPATPITVRQVSSNLGDGPTLTERRAPGALLIGFIDGGTRVVTSSPKDGTTDIRDATTLRTVRRFPGAGAPAAVSPNGRVAALAVPDGRLRLLDLGTGRTRVLGGNGRGITALAFTPDSTRLVIARDDAAPVVWDLDRAIPLKALGGLANVTRLALTADGATAYGAGNQGDVMAWDLTGARGLGRAFRAGSSASAVLPVTPGGPAVVVSDGPGHVDLIDARTLRRTRRIPAPAAARVAISPDGGTLVTGSRDGAMGFVDVRTGRPLGPPQSVHVGRVVSLAFSPDGRWLASAGADRIIYLWDARRRRTVKLYAAPVGSDEAPPTGLSFNPDGTRLALAVAHADGTGEVDVLSVPRLVMVARIAASKGGQTAFSRDGRRLFYRDDSGQMSTIDTRIWTVRGLPLNGAAKPADFALAPDDRTLVTTSADGTAQLWDVASGRAIGSPLGVGVARPVSAAFVAGGTALVTIADDGHGAVWDVRPRSWQIRACTIAGRPLKRREWQDVLPGRAYAPACAHGSD